MASHHIKPMLEDFYNHVVSNTKDASMGDFETIFGDFDYSKYDAFLCRKTGNKKRSKVDTKEACMARSWCEGDGKQCSKARKDGDYCALHAKKANESLVPLSRDELGSSYGLYLDRIDQPIPYKFQLADGTWEIRENRWTDVETQRLIKSDIDAGVPRGMNLQQAKAARKVKLGTRKSKHMVALAQALDNETKELKETKISLDSFLASGSTTVLSPVKAEESVEAIAEAKPVVAKAVVAKPVEESVVAKPVEESVEAIVEESVEAIVEAKPVEESTEESVVAIAEESVEAIVEESVEAKPEKKTVITSDDGVDVLSDMNETQWIVASDGRVGKPEECGENVPVVGFWKECAGERGEDFERVVASKSAPVLY